MKYQHLAIACTAVNLVLWAAGSKWLAEPTAPAEAMALSPATPASSVLKPRAEAPPPSSLRFAGTAPAYSAAPNCEQYVAAPPSPSSRPASPSPSPASRAESAAFASRAAALSPAPVAPAENSDAPSASPAVWQNPLWISPTQSPESAAAVRQLASLPFGQPLSKVDFTLNLPISENQVRVLDDLAADFDREVNPQPAPSRGGSGPAKSQPAANQPALPSSESPQDRRARERAARQFNDDRLRARLGNEMFIRLSLEAAKVRHSN